MEGVTAQTPCLIQPLCGTSLALTVTKADNQVSVKATVSPPAPAGQLWQFVPFSPDNELLGFALVNGLTGQAAYPPPVPGQERYVSTESLAEVTAASLWEVSPWGRVESQFRIFAVDDLTRNLNVAQGRFGCSDGQDVIVFEWGDGQPNEVWKLTPIQRS
jgi:hypothetical protein